tara:strand:+ start:1021 stop:1140 length:120 start_codon:yes stop_codon:yes gene_type:complete
LTTTGATGAEHVYEYPENAVLEIDGTKDLFGLAQRRVLV